MPTKQKAPGPAARKDTQSVRPSSHRSNSTKKSVFLASLRAGNTVKNAATACGVHRRTLYDWRDQDPEFRAAWEDAIKESIEELEDEVRRRALDSSDKYSHILLMFLLKKHDPSYRENYKREVTVKHETVHEIEFSKEEVDEAIRILETQKQRSLRAGEDDAAAS